MDKNTIWEITISDLLQQAQDDMLRGMLSWDSAAPFEEFNKSMEEVPIAAPNPRNRKLMLD